MSDEEDIMVVRERDRVVYQPRGKGTRRIHATVREVCDGYVWVVGPRGFAAIRPEAVVEVRRAASREGD